MDRRLTVFALVFAGLTAAIYLFLPVVVVCSIFVNLFGAALLFAVG